MTLSSLAQAPTPQSTLTVEPEQVQAGQIARLHWKVPAGVRAFISELGTVTGPASGITPIQPHSTLTVLLIEDSGDQLAVTARRVNVTGIKGSDPNCPDPSRPLTVKEDYNFGHTDALRLIERAKATLSRDFPVIRFELPDGNIIVATCFSENVIPVDKNEHPQKTRKIAYRLSLTKRGKNVNVEISTSIKWRYPIDDVWYTEDNLQLAMRMISELKQKLDQ